MAHIFVTGGTGFIGMHTLLQLSREKHTITVLVRSRKKWEQVNRQMSLEAGWNSAYMTPVIGDLAAPGLGLTEADRELALAADVIIHAGGPMDILLGEEEARAAFLQAADEMLALAAHIHKRKGLRHLIHVVGFKSPVTDENASSPEPVIARLEKYPPYERMKFLADLHIRRGARKEGFPLSVIHPSVVIGSSEHGNTPQTGGLGILVGSTARKLMGLVPGGKSHWLPLVHVDHAAEFISALAGESEPANGTYYLMDEKRQNPSMVKLASEMAKELRVGKPLGSITPALLSKVLGTPLGRKLGIPKESLDFIVDVGYPLEAARGVQRKHGLAHAVNATVLPFTFTDLEFRLHHSAPDPAGYFHSKRGPLAALERKGSGPETNPPIVFVHGTLSGADCLIPLADQFPESSVCLVDLPGFGRSPYHHRQGVLKGHVESLVQAIRSFDTPVTLVGHSLGGLLAAKALERVPELIAGLHLLQPVLHSAPRLYRSARMTELALRRLDAAGLRKQLLAQSCFERIEDIPPAYADYVLGELRSPRVRKTTAEALAALTRVESFEVSPAALLKGQISILWGTKDRVYQLPERYRSFRTVQIPEAHHFPLSHPEQTARHLRQLILP